MQKWLFVGASAMALYAGVARADAQSATFGIINTSQPYSHPQVLDLGGSLTLPSGDFSATFDVNFAPVLLAQYFSAPTYVFERQDVTTGANYYKEVVTQIRQFSSSPPVAQLTLFSNSPSLETVIYVDAAQFHDDTVQGSARTIFGQTCPIALGPHCVVDNGETDTESRGWWGDGSTTVTLGQAQADSINRTGEITLEAFYNATSTNSVSDSGALTIATPEPATWALMIVGFGGAGAMLRRRRKAGFA